MDTTAMWNVKERGDTVRLVGLGILDSPQCSDHATSLHQRVLFKHVCELGGMSTVGRSGTNKHYQGWLLIQGGVMDI